MGVVVDGIGGATVGPLPTVENTIKYASEAQNIIYHSVPDPYSFSLSHTSSIHL